MSFDEREKSVSDGKPVILYLFNRGLKKWAYCSADRPIISGGVTYLPDASISDGGITQSGQAASDTFTVTLATSSALVALYHGTPPSDSIYLTVRHLHYGDDQAIVQWVGLIQQTKRIDQAQTEIMCQSLSATFLREGLRLGWDRDCGHTLYDHGCKVPKEDFAVEATITALTGTTITAAEFGALDDRWFDAGFIEWSLGDDVLERRPVESHVGDVVTLLAFTDGLTVGQTITIYPGCERIAPVCHAKFDNLLNYGGFPHMPGDSPFDGDPVF